MLETVVVEGEILLPPEMTPVTPVSIQVEVEDISRADMPSEVVGQQSIITRRLEGGEAIPFEIAIPSRLINAQRLYSVRAHIATSGSGEVERGDYITMQSYPVLTRGYGNRVTLAVRRV